MLSFFIKLSRTPLLRLLATLISRILVPTWPYTNYSIKATVFHPNYQRGGDDVLLRFPFKNTAKTSAAGLQETNCAVARRK